MTLLLALSILGCRSDKDVVDSDANIVDEDGDGSLAEDDCDDNDNTAFPGNPEVCDGVDNDCNGSVDDNVGETWYRDGDGDGYGGADSTVSCEVPSGYVDNSDDCDDADSTAYPEAAERCDDIDQDCDTVVDEEVQSTWYADADGDKYGDATASLDDCDPPDGYVSDSTDCDDAVASTNPGASELCNEVDDNCDGAVDEGLDQTWYADADADRYGDAETAITDCAQPEGYVADATDCDDDDASSNPGGTEVCDEADNDCDDSTDEEVQSTFYADSDSDGYGDPDSTEEACSASSGYVDNAQDCDDSDGDVNPDTVWYIDYDSDGYGSSNYTTTSCEQPSGYLADSSDCDDADADSYPGADETCDSADNDCDSTVDESPIDGSTWYADTDGDGYGDSTSTTESCDQPSGYVADDTDCYDSDSTAYPGSGARETPGDGIDQDCDGNDGCDDLDCDGLPDLVIADYYDGNYSTNLRLFYNDGGGFSDGDQDTISGYGFYDVKVSDVDGDGYQDIITASHYDGNYDTTSYVYYGSASGYSSSDADGMQTYGARRVVVEDLDSDGYEDIVYANQRSDTSTYSGVDSYVYWGSSSGYSGSNRTSLAGDSTMRVHAEDLDADGYSDIILCNFRSSSSDYSIDSYVYWGSSSGYSSSDRTSLPTLGCRGIETGDFDGDGTTDIAFAHYRSTSSNYNTSSYVYYQTTTGSYSTGSRDALGVPGAVDVVSGDFNADGLLDLAFSGYYNGSWSSATYVYVYMNSSSGFGSATKLGSRGNWGLTVADVDNDGYDNLANAQHYTGSSYSTTGYLWWGSSSGLTDSNSESVSTLGASHVIIGDVDADGYPELIYSNYYNGSWGSYASDYIYFGDSAYSYSSSNRDSLSTWGNWSSPVLVGDSSW